MTRTKQRRRSRGGFTLIEQIGLISLTATMILMATMWIHESLKMSNRFKNRRESHLAMSALSQQLQDDVRASQTIDFQPNKNQISLETSSGGKTVYRIIDNTVHMTVANGESINRRQQYQLSDEYFFKWDAAEIPVKVALQIYRHATPKISDESDQYDPESKLELVVSASVNRWGRPVIFGSSDMSNQ